ncbi:MAG: phosphoribosyl carboxyaminoimidazole mutase [Pirellulaceae bacterium]|nr:MAG: phosphoribosyl carboxyaminoimidazole mutase [Pirellulaceae bacterium]GIW93284.1 MAG: phosphoribosyl carboxyaminoimidazole mutase [Pirellulaceae bacterium]
MDHQRLRDWAERLYERRATPEQFLAALQSERSARLGPLTLDLDRQRRCGYPEVIFGERKTTETILAAVSRLLEAGQPVLVTRLADDKAEVLLKEFPFGVYHPVARTFRCVAPDAPAVSPSGRVAVITAGSGDLPVAEEAHQTLLWMNVSVRVIHDVGVAGPHRLPERLPEFRSADALVVVAGMEGALPSVVGGYVSCPVFAVPTSVGYGANLGGVAALLSMLNSCAANVAVVNIDAGFKAGYLAGLVAKRASASAAEGASIWESCDDSA